MAQTVFNARLKKVNLVTKQEDALTIPYIKLEVEMPLRGREHVVDALSRQIPNKLNWAVAPDYEQVSIFDNFKDAEKEANDSAEQVVFTDKSDEVIEEKTDDEEIKDSQEKAEDVPNETEKPKRGRPKKGNSSQE